MPNLNLQIFCYLKKHHAGQAKAITVKNLTNVFRELRVSDREIRQVLRELDMKGEPILTSIREPFGVFYAVTQAEIETYRANLISRLTALKERIQAIEKMRIEPEQFEMFE
jgi:hypothetical protein